MLELYKSYNSELTLISEPVTLVIEKIRPGTLKNPMAEKHGVYYNELADLYKKVDYYVNVFENNDGKLSSLKSSLKYVKSNREFLEKEVFNLKQIKDALELKLYGSSAKQEIGGHREAHHGLERGLAERRHTEKGSTAGISLDDYKYVSQQVAIALQNLVHKNSGSPKPCLTNRTVSNGLSYFLVCLM